MRSFAHILCLLSLMVAIAAFGERRGMILSKKPQAASGASSAHILADFESGANLDLFTTNANTAAHDITNMMSIGANLTVQTCHSNTANIRSNNLVRVSTTFARRGTRSLRAALTNDQSYIEIHLKTGFPIVSWSLWFRVDEQWNDGGFESYDVQDFRSDSGDFAINNIDTQNGVYTYGAHTGAGVAPGVTFTSNYWYNVQGHWNSNTMGYLLRFYSNGVSMGQASNDITSARVLNHFRLGHCDDHNQFNAGFFYVDDFEIWTNGTFPNTPVGGALP